MAIHIGLGNFSAAVSSNVYRTKDKPRFALGSRFCLRNILFAERIRDTDSIELMFVGIGFICFPIAVLAYTNINRKRAALDESEVKKYTPKQQREMGDKAPDFRYLV
jgi:hypothetical protein